MNEKYMEIIKEKDVYFMETVLDKIIINDGYEGIEILDNNLKLIKKLNIFKDIIIQYSYVNEKNNEMLLFCPGNECFVHINLNNYEVKTIFIENGLKDVLFSEIYLWEDDIVILDSYNMVFCKVDFSRNRLEIIKEEAVMGLYPAFYRFCSYISFKNVIDIFPKAYKAIVQENNDEFFVYNLDGSYEKIDIKSMYGITDFISDGKNIGLVYGDYIKIIGNNNEKLVNCEDKDVFIRASYLNNGNLAALSNSKLESLQNKVLIFKI